MMSEGYDAIVVNGASPTGLNSVLEEAVDRGIMIVGFDANIESDKVYNVNTDQVEYGRMLGEHLVASMGEKGNIIVMAGIEGNAVTLARQEGIHEVIDQYPGIKVLGSGYGEWDESTSAREFGKLMSAYADQGIDGVIDEGGGGHAIVQALQEYKIDIKDFPLAEGEMFNSFMKDWVDYDMTKVFTTAQPPYLSAAAVDVTIKLLRGEAVEKMTLIPTPTCDSVERAKELYAPDMDGNFICDWTDDANSFGLTLEEVFPTNSES
jgi:ribose transport system substrate-binding protein